MYPSECPHEMPFAFLNVILKNGESKLTPYLSTKKDAYRYHLAEFLFIDDPYYRTPTELVFLQGPLNILEQSINKHLKCIILSLNLRN